MNPVRNLKHRRADSSSSGLSLFFNKWLYSKKAIVIFTMFVILLSLIFIKSGHIALPILNLSLISITVAAFEYGYAFSYFISIAISLVIFITMTYNPTFKLPFLASTVFLNLAPLMPAYYNRIYNDYRILKKSALNKTTASFDEFSMELKVLKELNATLENQVSQVLDLYEVTKKISASLDMIETLKVFRDAVKGILKFSKLKLILIDETQESPVASMTYEILGAVSGTSEMASAADISKVYPSQLDQILVEIVSARKEVIYLKSPIDDRHPLKGYLEEYKESFTALPLLSEGMPIGILTILGAEEDQIEKLLIMAEQLALEVKKVSLYERVQMLAITDGLTNVYVRRHFLERLNEEMARSKRHNLHLSVLMLDLDHFKGCNDTYGHLVGDIVLKEIAKILKEHVRQVDLVGRYGGEEFVIALPDTNKTSAANVAERIRQSAERYRFKAYDEIITTTVSMGLATYPDDGRDVPALIDRADQALYKAKEEGRNRVVLWP